jgi:hypothetical protein
MKLNRSIANIYRNGSEEIESPSSLTGAEAISFLWELSKEVYSLSGKYDVKSRLQRNVVSITRPQS